MEVYARVYWFSVKLRRKQAAEGEIPPCGRGFSRHEDLSSDLFLGGVSRPRTCHRYDESARYRSARLRPRRACFRFT